MTVNSPVIPVIQDTLDTVGPTQGLGSAGTRGRRRWLLMTSSTMENWRKIGQILGSYLLSHGGPKKHDGRREEALKNNRGGGSSEDRSNEKTIV